MEEKKDKPFKTGWKAKLEYGNIDNFLELVTPYCANAVITITPESGLKAILTLLFIEKPLEVHQGETVTTGKAIPRTLPQLHELVIEE